MVTFALRAAAFFTSSDTEQHRTQKYAKLAKSRTTSG